MAATPRPAVPTRSFRANGINVTVGPTALFECRQELAELLGLRPLVVIGAAASRNIALREAIDVGLQADAVAVHIKTASGKSIDAIRAGVQAAREHGATGVIAAGGGDALDLGKHVSYFAGASESFASAQRSPQSWSIDAFESSGLPLATIPATLAGSGLSAWATANFSDESGVGATVSLQVRSHLVAAIYDVPVFAATPRPYLRSTFFNGLHKGLETLFSRGSSPLSDATAIRGSQRLISGSVALADDVEQDPAALLALAEGIVLVQINRRLSLIHAIGHGLAKSSHLQQGLAHACISTASLAWLLPRLGPERSRIIEAVSTGAHTSDDAAVLGAIDAVRRRLALPEHLADAGLYAVPEGALDNILGDRLLVGLPRHIVLDRSGLEEILLRAA